MNSNQSTISMTIANEEHWRAVAPCAEISVSKRPLRMTPGIKIAVVGLNDFNTYEATAFFERSEMKCKFIETEKETDWFPMNGGISPFPQQKWTIGPIMGADLDGVLDFSSKTTTTDEKEDGSRHAVIHAKHVYTIRIELREVETGRKFDYAPKEIRFVGLNNKSERMQEQKMKLDALNGKAPKAPTKRRKAATIDDGPLPKKPAPAANHHQQIHQENYETPVYQSQEPYASPVPQGQELYVAPISEFSEELQPDAGLQYMDLSNNHERALVERNVQNTEPFDYFGEKYDWTFGQREQFDENSLNLNIY